MLCFEHVLFYDDWPFGIDVQLDPAFAVAAKTYAIEYVGELKANAGAVAVVTFVGFHVCVYVCDWWSALRAANRPEWAALPISVIRATSSMSARGLSNLPSSKEATRGLASGQVAV